MEAEGGLIGLQAEEHQGLRKSHDTDSPPEPSEKVLWSESVPHKIHWVKPNPQRDGFRK